MGCRRVLMGIFLCLLVVGITLKFEQSRADDQCRTWIGKLVSLQGEAFAKRQGAADWQPVQLENTFCPGDRIRVAANSRAAFVLSNDALLRADQNTSLVFTGVEQEETFLIELFKGAAHFFSRKARSLKIITPFVNGTVEGTEFFVRVEQEQTLVSLFEGRIRTENQQGSLLLAKGQACVAKTGQAPRLEQVVRPRDAVQWALYYPPVLSFDAGQISRIQPKAIQDQVQTAYHYFSSRDYAAALAVLEAPGMDSTDPSFFTLRAGLRLAVGRVSEAILDISKALVLEPGNSRAMALQAVMAVVRNRRDEAMELALSAVRSDPQAAAARIALSYAHQAAFNLPAALKEIHAAVTVEPENGIAWSRLAELRLAMGDLDQALSDARKAARLNPELSRSNTILGFAYLTQIKTAKARQAFQQAIELDSAAPMPRLGLGMALIREGQLHEGRGQIEIAAGLDPDNSLIRSYLGKAYFDEKRDPKDGDQLAIAKELDPNDPTPWFYDAIRKQSLNRPVEALHDLQKSIELNDNRAVYRSRFQLDEDLASRGVGLGRIYNDLGFRQMGLVEGWKSLSDDPGNYSAHRLLADTYTALPRHEHARSSELLQAQLMQPITLAPVQPRMGETDLFFLESAGLNSPALNEFSRLYVRDRTNVQFNGVVGDHATEGEEMIMNSVSGPVSVSASQFHFTTDGFRENNDQTLEAYDLFGQVALSHTTSTLVEFRNFDEEKGDLSLKFDPDNYVNTMRQTDDKHSLRLGLRHDLTPDQMLLLSSTFIDGHETAQVGGNNFKYDLMNYYYEGRYTVKSDSVNLTTGVGHYRREAVEKVNLSLPPISQRTDYVEKHRYAYLYYYLSLPESLSWTLGTSIDNYEDRNYEDIQGNPKIGMVWQPFFATTIRAAYFRVYNREYASMPTIEPSNIAGFNQLYDDGQGANVWSKGVALDQKIFDTFFIGVEYVRRDIEMPFLDYTSLEPESRHASWEEDLWRGYLYWTPSTWIAPALDIYHEKFERKTGLGIPTDISELETLRVIPAVTFFFDSGLCVNLEALYIEQKCEFYDFMTGSSSGEDKFWVFNMKLKYNLPKRMGFLSLKVNNLLDEEFRYQDTDPANSFVPPSRQILMQCTLSF